jgi:hypothetical protein
MFARLAYNSVRSYLDIYLINHPKSQNDALFFVQMKAARSILRNGLTVVSGRGGTGKTELVAAVLGMAETHMDKAQVGYH